jgi:hypothetical protein
MSMTADLRDVLRDAGIAGGSVYRDRRPQDAALPAVVLQLIDDPRSSFMAGENALRSSLVQADIWAVSRGDADAICDALLVARPLRAVRGVTDFRRIYVDAVRNDSEVPAGQAPVFRTTLDLAVWWRPIS